ncbi:universal stress protein [Nocardioides sp. SR21]|uniref:universal stress protein n=1 Tax=Nocardioides sp. SR21 TaxID=2919501 RepID=UPI001FAAA22E|nr:universal stress protein [Nocardioides sp. SR21]
MAKTILCGVDNTNTAAAAARKAAGLAVALGAELHLLSAYGKVESETVEVGSETILVSNEMEAERVAGAIAVELRQEFPGLAVHAAASEGRPGDALVSAAERLDADLIVVGNKRVQGIARVLGSIARDVAAHAPCDVYVALTHRG